MERDFTVVAFAKTLWNLRRMRGRHASGEGRPICGKKTVIVVT